MSATDTPLRVGRALSQQPIDDRLHELDRTLGRSGEAATHRRRQAQVHPAFGVVEGLWCITAVMRYLRAPHSGLSSAPEGRIEKEPR